MFLNNHSIIDDLFLKYLIISAIGVFNKMSEEDEVSLNFFEEYHRRQVEEINRSIINFHLRQEEAFHQFLTVPPDFWEPVKITIKDTEKFKFIEEKWECTICRENRSKKTRLECCNQEMCDSCIENWFTKESIHCPFCKKDIRDIYNNFVQ